MVSIRVPYLEVMAKAHAVIITSEMATYVDQFHNSVCRHYLIVDSRGRERHLNCRLGS